MKNILVLYNGQSMFTPTVKDYVDAFRKYSRNNVHYMHAYSNTMPQFSFDEYDAIIITYSCRLCYLELWSPHVREAIAAFPGLKIAMPQDEYQETNKLRDGLCELGIKLVFTCVPEDKIDWVYPSQLFPGVRFERILTGYVPNHLRSMPRRQLPPMTDRPNWIGYRGRSIGHNFGDLAFFKAEIGPRFKRACELRSVPNDIAWSEEARIYQDKWYAFTTSCRATLGTPSGSNVFDFDGSIERDCKTLIAAAPDTSYASYRPTIAHKEAEIDMGQASPRIFEAAALGTVLVLLEGQYSGVVIPGIDCIMVRKDFSNIDDVLDQIGDISHMQKVADAAYHNIIASNNWSYESFIEKIDTSIENQLEAGRDDVQINSQRLKPKKAFDTAFIEARSLKSQMQYPMSQWLDLSHVRDNTLDGGNQFRLWSDEASQVETSVSRSPQDQHDAEPIAAVRSSMLGLLSTQRKYLRDQSRPKVIAAAKALKAAVPLKIKQAIKDVMRNKS